MNYWLIRCSLFLNYFVFALLLFSVGTVILQVQNSFGVSETSAAALEVFKDLPIAITSFLLASFVVKIGYKRTMQLALLLIALVCLLVPQLPYFWMIKVLFVAIGVCFALNKVSVLASLGLVAKDQRQHAGMMNFIESFFMVGVLTGYFVFSFFVNDQKPGSQEWLNVYYLLAAVAFGALVLLSVSSLDESPLVTEETSSLGQDFGHMIKLAFRGLVMVFLLCAFLYVLIEQSIMSWLPTFNSHILKLPASLSIEMASIMAACTAFGRFGAGILVKRLGWYPLLTGGLLLSGLLVVLVLPLAEVAGSREISSWADAPLAAFVFPCIGLCLAPVYPVINSLILSALPKHHHAPMSGLIVVFSALGGTCGSLMMGWLFSRFGGQVAFYFSLVPLSLLLVSLYRFKRIMPEKPLQ